MDGLWFGIERQELPRRRGAPPDEPLETRPVLIVTLDDVKMCTIADFKDDDAQLLGQKVLDRVNAAVTRASRDLRDPGAALGSLIQTEGVG